MKKHFLAGGAILLVTVVVLLALTYTSAGKGLGAQLFGIGNIVAKKAPLPPDPARQQGSSPTSPCALLITPLTAPAAQSVPIGTNVFDFAHIKLTAPVGCNATLIHLTTGAMVISPSLIPASLKNIKVYNLATGIQLGSTIATPTIDPSQFNYSYDTISTNLSILGGSSVTLAIKADVIGATANLVQFGFTNVDAVQTGTTTQVGAGNAWWAKDYWGQVMSLGSPQTAVCNNPATYAGQWGAPGSGNGQLRGITGMATDSSGNVYVADWANNRIQKFSSAGTYLTQWSVTQPFGIAIDGFGNVYVGKQQSDSVVKFTSSGTLITSWSIPGVISSSSAQGPWIATDSSGDVYVEDTENNWIYKFTSSGTVITSWGGTGTGNGQFNNPQGIAVGANGNVYISDTDNNRVMEFTSTGAYINQWGTRGSGNGQFNPPTGITADHSGNIYVADLGNYRVQKFTSTGTYITQWASQSAGTGNGQINTPYGITTDLSGNIYVANWGSSYVQKFSPTCIQS